MGIPAWGVTLALWALASFMSWVGVWGIVVFAFRLAGVVTVVGWVYYSYKFGWWGITDSQAALNATEDTSGTQDDDNPICWALGARNPSKQEDEFLALARSRVQEGWDNQQLLARFPLSFHDHTYVVDSPIPQSFTLGRDMFITSAAVRSEYLTVLIAHELGHFNHGDGQLLLALQSFVYPFIRYRMTTLGKLSTAVYLKKADRATSSPQVMYGLWERFTVYFFSILFGGFGVMRFSLPWGKFFRAADKRADEYAIRAGLGEDLVAYLESAEVLETSSPFFVDWSEYVELRVDALREGIEARTRWTQPDIPEGTKITVTRRKRPVLEDAPA